MDSTLSQHAFNEGVSTDLPRHGKSSITVKSSGAVVKSTISRTGSAAGTYISVELGARYANWITMPINVTYIESFF